MNTKRRKAFNLPISTIQQLKIKMAEMDMVNQSQLVDKLILNWLQENKKGLRV